MKTRVMKFAAAAAIIGTFVACSTGEKVATKEPNAGREPASYCHPTPEDLEQDARIAADPDKYKQLKSDLMRAQVQIYVRATELTHDFDARLDRGETLKSIYNSETYMQLLALQEIRRKVRHQLENYFAADLKKLEGRYPSPAQHVTAVHTLVDRYRDEFEAIIQARRQSRFVRLALLDIQEDFEDLRTYYVTCDYNDLHQASALHQAFKDRLDERMRKTRDIVASLPIIKEAYKDFGPQSPMETDIGAILKKASAEIREEVREHTNRSPQASEKLEPSVGPNGNMFGDKFPVNTWALTYDDGPGATTHLVLDNLKKHNMKATFFMLSQQISNPAFVEVAKRVQEEGHAIACHSFTHPQIPKLDQAGRTHEIVDAKEVFTKFFSKEPGDTPPRFFRLPYGAGVSVPSVRQMIADNNMIHVYWNVDTLDWQDHNPESIHDRALKQIKQLKRGIILFHDIHPQSVIASELLMHDFEDPANHIRLVTIPEITDELNAQVKEAPTVPVKQAGSNPADADLYQRPTSHPADIKKSELPEPVMQDVPVDVPDKPSFK